MSFRVNVFLLWTGTLSTLTDSGEGTGRDARHPLGPLFFFFIFMSLWKTCQNYRLVLQSLELLSLSEKSWIRHWLRFAGQHHVNMIPDTVLIAPFPRAEPLSPEHEIWFFKLQFKDRFGPNMAYKQGICLIDGLTLWPHWTDLNFSFRFDNMQKCPLCSEKCSKNSILLIIRSDIWHKIAW